MKTAELAGADLDYWVARAEGIPAEQLEIRGVPRTDLRICVTSRLIVEGHEGSRYTEVLAYSTNWMQGGPLIEKHQLTVLCGGGWHAGKSFMHEFCAGDGDGEGGTPLIAICRAVVCAAFGNEVEDLPC